MIAVLAESRPVDDVTDPSLLLPLSLLVGRLNDETEAFWILLLRRTKSWLCTAEMDMIVKTRSAIAYGPINKSLER